MSLRCTYVGCEPTVVFIPPFFLRTEALGSGEYSVQVTGYIDLPIDDIQEELSHALLLHPLYIDGQRVR
jgi:hypothetical protein